MGAALGASTRTIRAGLRRLVETHAFCLQENGELWRAAPFFAVSTAFPVEAGNRRWWGNCIWDALGIPAMLGAALFSGCSRVAGRTFAGVAKVFELISRN